MHPGHVCVISNVFKQLAILKPKLRRSVVAVFMVVASALLLTNWLIARRAAAFAYRGQPEPRSPR